MQENIKKKVLYIITKGNFGGAQKYVFDLATHLPNTDYEVMVATGEGEKLEEALESRNIRSIKIENLDREINLKKDWQVIKSIKQLIINEEPDVVHLNSSKIGILGAKAVLLLKISNEFLPGKNYKIPKTIFTAHAWAFNEKTRPFFSRVVYFIAQYITLLLTNQTIAVSEKIKFQVARLPFVSNKIKVIYNGVENFKAEPKTKARETLIGEDNKNKIVLFSLSELHKNKGLDVALDAILLLSNEVRERLIYVIAGTGEEKDYLESKIRESNLGNQIKLLGFIPDAKTLLSGTDIFLLPSRTEAMPYALLEAGLVGVPTIATSVGGIPEVIKDMQGGILVHPHNPKELAEAILYMLDHKDKRKEFGIELKKTVTNFFSLDRMLRETFELYK